MNHISEEKQAIKIREVPDNHEVIKGLIPTLVVITVFTIVLALILRYVEYRLGF